MKYDSDLDIKQNTPNTQWQMTLLPAGSNLKEAIRNIDQSGLQIALLVSPERILIGTVTDGDIRRGLLQGLDINSTKAEIVSNREPVVAPSGLPRDVVLQIMKVNSIQQLPIVDDSRHVVGLHILNDLFFSPKRLNTMVVMAGGKGTRLQPLTKNYPKPLLPVAGKPMLEHILERAKTEGIDQFVFVLQYLGHMIEEYFGDGNHWGVQIDYLHEEQPLGTAGGLSLFQKRPELPFIVTNGDILTDIRYGDIIDFHVMHGATATMAVRLHEWQNPFGVVSLKGIDIIGFEEKPVIRSCVNAGIYVLDPNAIDELEAKAHCDMPTLFDRLQRQGQRTIAYPTHELWLDVGRNEEFQEAQSIFDQAVKSREK